MDTLYLSSVEKRAECAESLTMCSGVKILHIKKQIEQILSLIGRNQIFDQYTVHNISHINKMLKLCEWLIPTTTQDSMTKADWLMLVLSIYFHDLGMLVTIKEFKNKDINAKYNKFKDELFNGANGREYEKKVSELEGSAENFLYQEYVRYYHADRVCDWIQGRTTIDDCEEIISEINKILLNLSPKFRRDLAMVCQSHHMDDLDDFDKYKTDVRYGDEDNERVNLHFIAIILRTVDLLHITSDRTPSILYKLIEPTDPISIIEWKKQMAVSSVHAQKKRNNENIVDDSIDQDTIEVSAYFDKPDQAEAFFGLMSYIKYARLQIVSSYKAIQNSIKTQGTVNYLFPWQYIDDRDIETYGFERKQLQFELDQNNILQLLIGHTLYNDSSVVIRELIQNGIDAIKLQKTLIPTSDEGKIIVNWKTETRELKVCDNGTGMTLYEIENYLFKVGLSKYRTNEFKKKHPNFFAISRFGIGILTCFLISDNIDILTNSTDEENVNQISIRNVDGRYLLKKLSKVGLNEPIEKHGTVITLKVRSDVDMTKLLEESKKWILLPPCRIEFRINNQNPSIVGFGTPKEALIRYLAENQILVDDTNYKIIEEEKSGVTIAYVLKYSKYFRDWEFMKPLKDKSDFLPIGTCIDGICVEFDTPGFKSKNILALVNIRGNYSAYTNVSRNSFEDDPTTNDLLRTIYELYSNHIQNQINDLLSEGISSSRATSEAQYLVHPIIEENRAVNRDLLYNALSTISSVIIEIDGARSISTLNDVKSMKTLKVISCRIFSLTESLLREFPSNKSTQNILDFFQTSLSVEKTIPLLCGFTEYNIFHTEALRSKGVDSIQIDKGHKRIDLLFEEGNTNWLSFKTDLNSSSRRLYRFSNLRIHIPKEKYNIIGLTDNEIGVVTDNGIYLSYENEVTPYILLMNDVLDINNSSEYHYFFSKLLGIIIEILMIRDKYQNIDIDGYLDNISVDRNRFDLPSEPHLLKEQFWLKTNRTKLVSILANTDYILYDPSEWIRYY